MVGALGDGADSDISDPSYDPNTDSDLPDAYNFVLVDVLDHHSPIGLIGDDSNAKTAKAITTIRKTDRQSFIDFAEVVGEAAARIGEIISQVNAAKQKIKGEDLAQDVMEPVHQLSQVSDALLNIEHYARTINVTDEEEKPGYNPDAPNRAEVSNAARATTMAKVADLRHRAAIEPNPRQKRAYRQQADELEQGIQK